MIELELRFDGSMASNGAIDLYDAARALEGFQRSLALVTHLVLTGKVITQATSLTRDARIITRVPEEGSWKNRVWVLLGGAFAVGSVGADSPVGYAVTSLFDYVMNETMGFHVDYNKTFQQQVAETLAARQITSDRVDSLMEKTESAFVDMHRPIYYSGTATIADIHGQAGPRAPVKKLGPDMTLITYEYIAKTSRTEATSKLTGSVSSYNINTFRGRFFSKEHGRPIPFELMESAKNQNIIATITRSLQLSSVSRDDPRALLDLTAFQVETSTGRLKTLHVTNVELIDPSE